MEMNVAAALVYVHNRLLYLSLQSGIRLSI